ncbi:MAG: 4'-phosphopantetheinyl transferase superfamily protein [bacterium]|nr:4'-phosphopantetheinyl transferase superfamily protein [bacterium]
MHKIYISKKSTKDLLKEVLEENNINSNIIYNEYGKPYLENNEIYFNLSNSKDYSVCIISDKEVGIDIEYITYRTRIVDSIFNKKEKTNIPLEFTKTWVLKEAFVKKIGMGLTYGLKNVDTTKIEDYEIIEFDNYVIGIVY